MAIMKVPGKSDSMPKRVRQRALNMAMAGRSRGAPMPGAMSAAPMMTSPTAPPTVNPMPPMKKGGIVKEKASGERYASKASMRKHEAKEGKGMERKEDKMRGGGMATRGMGAALKKGGAVKKPGLMVMIAVGKGKKK